MQALGIFYGADNGGVDFIVRHLVSVIPVEVGVAIKRKVSLLVRWINMVLIGYFNFKYGL